jgi:hypothetical protein
MAHPACFGSTPYTLSAATLDDPFLDFGYGLTRVQTLWTGTRAIQNRVATIKPKRIFEIVQSFADRFVATVGEPTPRLQKCGGAEKPIPIPPMARATRCAAEAQDAFIVTIELASLVCGLEAFLHGLRRLGTEPGLDHLILRKQVV